MEFILLATVFLTVLNTSFSFNVDPVAWKTLSRSAEGFGYQVVQRQNSLLVSAPLEQVSQTERGQIFQCNTESCTPLSLPALPNDAVNMSLGLAMVNDPMTQTSLACGPTIPKDCRAITMYIGLCLPIDKRNRVGNPLPSVLPKCQGLADIAFLLDGSGSVRENEFDSMRTFVKNLVGAFSKTDTKFAIAQFSSGFRIHYHFDTFDIGNFKAQINSITQLGGSTFTGSAIARVVNEIFTESRGARRDMKKVLIVVTDGESNGGFDLKRAVNLAEGKNIIRFAIGVGNAFSSTRARDELITIASRPSAEHMFQVQNFGALDKIRDTLQQKIFSIEGSQSDGEKLKKEMSQWGFRAAFVSGGMQMSIVGANEWKGGFERYTSNGQQKSSYEPTDMNESYLGYSMAIANTPQGSLTIVGAPRYEHRGAVIVVKSNDAHQKIDPYQWQSQSGEYFGAEVCAMNLDRDTYTDLILISAPMYVEMDTEGRVYVCLLVGLRVDCHLDSPSLLKGAASGKGRFGASLAVLPDLNLDGLSDLAVGAPLENDNKGSIYIFNGEKGTRGINPTFSQRIAASEVGSGLMFFGMSISQSSFDQSQDQLPDLAVGSKGKVVLLRTKPIVMVEAMVSYSPNQVSPQDSDCSRPLNNKARVCFVMNRQSSINAARARINFTLTLDATRKEPNNRAYITDKKRDETRSFILDLSGQQCNDINFLIQPCPEDALNEIRNELRFTFEGLPSSTGLRPSLPQQAQTTAFFPLGFEINCGSDDKCVDNLRVDLNFSSSSVVKVGIDELLDLTVSIENLGENSYNTHVILTYPPGLSFRKFTVVGGRIQCNSLDSEDGSSRGKTDCTINQPIFKSNIKAVVIVSYGIETNGQHGSNMYFTANATSGNKEHAPSSVLYRRKDIGVKYSIFVTMESTLSYNNFTFGKNDLQKPVQQTILVSNDIRALNFTVVLKVPVKLGDKDIWVDSSSLQIPDCSRDRDQRPSVTNFAPQIQKNKIVNCSVASCAVFKCTRLMARLESKKYQISANISSRWIEQIGLKSAKYLLTSTASLEYDQSQYIFFSTASNNNPPIRKIEAVVDVYPEPDFTKEIVGGSLGGLVLLALITAGLYKAGFFKSKYQQRMTEGAGDAGGPAPDEEPPTLE